MRGKSNRGWESVFFAHYGETRNFLQACDLADVPPQTVRDRREKDKAFDAKCDECLERYEENVRVRINQRKDAVMVSDAFLSNMAKAVLPEWRPEKPLVTINNHNSATVISAEETIRKFRDLAGIQ